MTRAHTDDAIETIHKQPSTHARNRAPTCYNDANNKCSMLPMLWFASSGHGGRRVPQSESESSELTSELDELELDWALESELELGST